METTTKQITLELHDKIIGQLMPIAKDLRKSGWSDRRIDGLLRKVIKAKSIEFYKEKDFSTIDKQDLLNKLKADSKAEVLFYDILCKNNTDFRFQYKIGPYRVDYLIGESLIVEIDGPHHERQVEYDTKRDAYLEGLGFKILRIPINYVVVDSDAVIKSIKDIP